MVKRQNNLDSLENNYESKDIDSSTLTMIRECSEYFVQLSVLVLSTQKYLSSIVAWSWVLAARKICNIEPLWSKEMENLTWYSASDLINWMNMLLDSIEVLKLGSENYNTVTLLGKPPERLFTWLSQKDNLKMSFIGNKSKILVNKNGIWTTTLIKEENDHFKNSIEQKVEHHKTSFKNSPLGVFLTSVS